jgi:hypothetical protein
MEQILIEKELEIARSRVLEDSLMRRRRFYY